MPIGAAARRPSADVRAARVGDAPPTPRTARAPRRARAARGRPSRPGCSRRRRRGTGPPSAGRTRRRPGRRSGSGRPRHARRGRRTGGGRSTASTGVSASAAWMSGRPPGRVSTTIVVPGSKRPSSSVLGERVLDHVLDHAAQRPRAVGDVVAELDDVLLGRLGDLERASAGPGAGRARGRASGRRSGGSPRPSASGRRPSRRSRLRNSGRNFVLSSAETFSFIRSYGLSACGSRPCRRSARKPRLEFVWSCFAPRLLVMMMIVLRKSTRRPLASERCPSSRIWRRMLKTSGWAFSISSRSTTQ